MKDIKHGEVFLLMFLSVAGGAVAGFGIMAFISMVSPILEARWDIFILAVALFALIGFPIFYLIARYGLVKWHLFALVGFLGGPCGAVAVLNETIEFKLVVVIAAASAMGAMLVFIGHAGFNEKI